MATEVPNAVRPEIVFPLSEPLATHQGILNELTLKCPNAGVFMKHGAPFKRYTVGAGDEARQYAEHNYPAVFHIAAKASGVHESLLETMSAADAYMLGEVVVQLCFPTKLKTTSA